MRSRSCRSPEARPEHRSHAPPAHRRPSAEPRSTRHETRAGCAPAAGGRRRVRDGFRPRPRCAPHREADLSEDAADRAPPGSSERNAASHASTSEAPPAHGTSGCAATRNASTPRSSTAATRSAQPTPSRPTGPAPARAADDQPCDASSTSDSPGRERSGPSTPRSRRPRPCSSEERQPGTPTDPRPAATSPGPRTRCCPVGGRSVAAAAQSGSQTNHSA